jgi:predicted metal-dependent hydrolase
MMLANYTFLTLRTNIHINRIKLLHKMNINITRKSTKYIRMSLDMSNNSLNISAPKFLSDVKIYEFIKSKESWVQKKLVNQTSLTSLQFQIEDGAELLIWGKVYKINLINNEELKDQFYLDELSKILNINSAKIKNIDKIASHLNQYFNGLLENYISSIIPTWTQKLNVTPSKITLKTAKSRWGSCNTYSKNIMLNSKLIHLKPELIEYVLMHELVHLLEPSHNKRFHRLCDQHMSDYRLRVKEFKQIKL